MSSKKSSSMGSAVPKNKRVMKEIEACESDKEAKVKIEVIDDNLSGLLDLLGARRVFLFLVGPGLT